MIGKIQRVPLREVWKHGEPEFTAWLENNADVLSDALDLPLANVERERPAGTFSVDLVAEDESAQPVIIENQLGKSDHDHLGKLVTYLTSLEARAAIWIVSKPRPEHVRAISWLNEGSSASFYLVKVEAIKIGDSPAAPLLTLITGPSAEATTIGEEKKELAKRYAVRKAFWTGLLDKAKTKTKLHSGSSPGQQMWIATSAGLPSGLSLDYVIRRHDGKVELYIDADQETGEGNTRILNKLLTHKDDIEKVFGEPLEWEALEGKRACRILKTIPGGGWQDEANWPVVQDAMVDAMIRLDKALRPYLKEL